MLTTRDCPRRGHRPQPELSCLFLVRNNFETGDFGDNHGKLRRSSCLPRLRPTMNRAPASNHFSIAPPVDFARTKNSLQFWLSLHPRGRAREGTNTHGSAACGHATTSASSFVFLPGRLQLSTPRLNGTRKLHRLLT